MLTASVEVTPRLSKGSRTSIPAGVLPVAAAKRSHNQRRTTASSHPTAAPSLLGSTIADPLPSSDPGR
ncbi:MAG TPA: hypothetical protein VKP11_01800, partial [Frankiaceae bacterium]|nr:hypothetical protein [Frankiaceae bacterium]